MSTKNYYSSDDSICDFLFLYSIRFHLITKVSPYKAMMNSIYKEFWVKIKKNILKRQKAKSVYITSPDGSNVRVSNYIKIIDKQYVVFILQEDLKSP